jgi:hypothetical protein
MPKILKKKSSGNKINDMLRYWQMFKFLAGKYYNKTTLTLNLLNLCSKFALFVILTVYLKIRGPPGRVVKTVDFKPLAPHRCGFESQLGLWILSCEEAIQLAYGTSVVLLRCPTVPEIMQGRVPEVFLHQ